MEGSWVVPAAGLPDSVSAAMRCPIGWLVRGLAKLSSP